jgi:hypothetical protein
MNSRNAIAKHNAKHRRDNQKRYVHEEIKTSAMKRCWINTKTFILISADADEETERKKYMENQAHYNSLYDPYLRRVPKNGSANS